MTQQKRPLLATRLLLSLLAMLTASTAWAGITGSGTAEAPYVLSNVDDWNTFATNVNTGTDADKYYKLSDSWDNSANGITIMVGTNKPFCGTFDGNGKTLTVSLTATTNNCAPFAYLKGANIKNLTIEGSVTTSAQYGASLATHTSGTTHITNCHSTVTIESTATSSGDGTHGGFVAVNENSATLNFERCTFKGEMLGANATSNGGFVGWAYSTVSYTDCLFAPTELTMSTSDSYTFNRNGNNSFTRTYYTTAFGDAQGTKVLASAPDGVVSKSMTLADGGTYYVPATISGIKNYYLHTGNEISIDYTVTAEDGTTLAKGTDYTETFDPATVQDAGDYTLTITGISPNATGSQTFNFTVTDALEVTASTTALEDGIYKVSSDVAVSSRITVDGDVTLILCDGYTLTAENGIEVSENKTLTINGESLNTGKLISKGEYNKSGIGSSTLGHIIINGGTIEATGGNGGAGIGGNSKNNDSGSITINGGIVTAKGKSGGAGIGGGEGNYEGTWGKCPTIVINGGQVTATGDGLAPGIGPGYAPLSETSTSGSLTLSWTNSTDFVQATSSSDNPKYCGISNRIRTISLAKDFFIVRYGNAAVEDIKEKQSLRLIPRTDAAKKDLVNATITGVNATYNYTGNDITINPTVTSAVSHNLTNGTDYTMSFSRNGESVTSAKDPGNYTLTFTGTGEYTGSQTVGFRVSMSAPTNLKQTAYTSTSATLTWEQSESAVQEWKLEYSTNNSFSSDVTTVTVNEKTYTLTNMTPESTYFVRVSAVAGDMEKTSSFLPVIATEKKLAGINSELETNGDYPFSSSTVYSLTEQIYTPAEIGGIGTIQSLAFCNTSATSTTRTIDIYMVHTSKDAFSSETDWIHPTAGNKVFSGNVTFNGNYAWTTITLDKPFVYDGTDNLAIIIDSNGEQDDTGSKFLVYPTSSNQAISLKSNDEDSDPLTVSASGTLNSNKNQILFGATPPLALSDDDDNTSLLVVHSGNLMVQLQGRTLYKDGSWNTLCLPFTLTAEQIAASPLAGATIKELSKQSFLNEKDGKLTLIFEEAKGIVAGKPYILKWVESSEANIKDPLFAGVTISAITPEPVTFGNGGKCQFVGQFSPFSIVESGADASKNEGNLNEIILMGSGSTLGYSKTERTLRPFRAHFYVPANDSSAGARSFVLDFGDDDSTSGIIEVEADSSLFSLHSSLKEGWYDLNGRRLAGKPAAKGVYIQNGKKVIIK